MNTLLTIILTIIGSGGLFSFIQFLFTRHDGKKNYVTKEEMDEKFSAQNVALDLLKEAALASMQDRLEFIMSKYLKEGEISVNQYKALTHMVEAYKGLGGNSFVAEMYERCKELV